MLLHYMTSRQCNINLTSGEHNWFTGNYPRHRLNTTCTFSLVFPMTDRITGSSQLHRMTYTKTHSFTRCWRVNRMWKNGQIDRNNWVNITMEWPARILMIIICLGKYVMNLCAIELLAVQMAPQVANHFFWGGVGTYIRTCKKRIEIWLIVSSCSRHCRTDRSINS